MAQQAPASYGNTAVGTNRPLQTPWLDFANPTVPESHDLVLWWAQFLWLTDGNYRSAMERVAAHFLTVIEFPDLEPDEESAWRDLFLKHINYRRELAACAHDFLCYGNLFVSLYVPFNRFAICRNCGFEQPLARVEYDLEFSDNVQDPLIWRRCQPCPNCKDHAPYVVKDRRSNQLDKVRLNRWSPFEIQLAMNRFSQRKDIFWKIPEYERRRITQKARIHIDDTPLEILKAVATGGVFEFDEDMILHVDETCISGFNNEGWGIPRSISNFRIAWLQQLVNKADQAVAIDYTLGMRVLSPAPTPGGVDPMQNNGMQQFVAHIGAMVQTHRNNPASYQTAPFPLQYQFLGGEGGQLIPPDKLKFRHAEFLSQLGVPVEYHQMNLSTQAAPMALRLFESYWQAIPAFYNQILAWIVKRLTDAFDLDETSVQMQRTTVVDDMNYKAMLLQLMGGNQLSPQTALEPMGIDASKEVQKVLRHQDFVERQSREFEEKARKRDELQALRQQAAAPTPSSMMQQQQAGGQPMPPDAAMGGMPVGGMPGAGPTNQSLADLSAQAAQIAQQLAPMDEFSRKQQLKSLREGNKELHALVMAELGRVRSQARAQGQQMLLQAPPGGQAGGPR